MKKYVPTLVRHWPAFILAVAVGLIVVSAHWYFALHSSGFAGINMLGADAEDHYAARVQEVYDGHPLARNTFLPDKTIPYLIPSLGENIVAWSGYITAQTAANAIILAKFLFPLLAVLVIYGLCRTLGTNKSAALVAAAFVTLGDGLLSSSAQIRALLHGSADVNTFLNYARPINPEISSLFLFGTLILIYRAFVADRNPRSWEYIAVGLATGLSLYVSPFIFSFLVVVQTLACINLFVTKERTRSYALILSGITVIVVGIPFIVNYIALRHSPAYLDTIMRQGFSASHAPIAGWWIPIIALILLFIWPKSLRNARIFFFCSTGALLILLNQQIITGTIVQPGHYHWYVTLPLAAIILSIVICDLIARMIRNGLARKAAYVLILALLVWNGIAVQVHSYAGARPGYEAVQRYAPIFDFLRSQPANLFVWANSTISSYGPIYTSDNYANNRQISGYLVPRSYFESALLLEYRLRGISTKDIYSVLNTERDYVSSYIYALYWRDHAGSFAAIPDLDLMILSVKYATKQKIPLKDELHDLGITTIIWDSATEPSWHIDKLPFVTEIYRAGTIQVYTVKY